MRAGENAAARWRYQAALKIAADLKATGRLAPADAWMIGELEKRLAALPGDPAGDQASSVGSSVAQPSNQRFEVAERAVKPVHEAPFVLQKENGLRAELVLQWTESTDEHVRSYVNGIPTGSGGTHENGLRAGIGKAIRNYIETHNLTPKGVTLTAEDIREGMTGVLSVFICEPQFQGQTKDRLNNPEMMSAVDGMVRVSVEDGGRGMNPEFLERLFGKFEHAQGSLTRENQGAGLGLAICRHIVTAHGGTIWAESPGEGKGATFHFTLPAADRQGAVGLLGGKQAETKLAERRLAPAVRAEVARRTPQSAPV